MSSLTRLARPFLFAAIVLAGCKSEPAASATSAPTSTPPSPLPAPTPLAQWRPENTADAQVVAIIHDAVDHGGFRHHHWTAKTLGVLKAPPAVSIPSDLEFVMYGGAPQIPAAPVVLYAVYFDQADHKHLRATGWRVATESELAQARSAPQPPSLQPIDAAKAEKADVVLRIRDAQNQGGSKFHHWTAKTVSTVKAPPDVKIPEDLNFAMYGWEPEIPTALTEVYFVYFDAQVRATMRAIGWSSVP